MTRDDREVEIKLRVDGPVKSIRERLESVGLRVSKPRVFESNTVFDTADGKLRNANELLRLRRVGNERILTYKGPPSPGKHKSREELETGVADERAMEQILARLGFAPNFRYEKFRTEYEAPGQEGTVTLDETPIGVYLEIEAAPEWIDQMATKLGFSEDQYITKSYGSLYFDSSREHGITPTHMVFEPEAERP